MAYFKINDNDYSTYVTMLKVGTEHFYNLKGSANGADRISYKYKKRTIEVGIIPLDDTTMKNLLTDIKDFRIKISYRDPETNALVENLECIVPNNIVEYYTIRADKVMYKAFSLQFKEVNYIGEID